MTYIRKTKTVYILMIKYDEHHWWEEEWEYDTLKEYKQAKKEYNSNCSYPVKLKQKRVPIS